ncbi:2-oxo acid dehydrogenase subunit E2, partial [Ruminococcaceae bacterium OttesenSCG-928-D13]|nr:2-oxo acid dehydrogenase subunit E2 [Ruminococcaceae bacterium OttesenSCG-928-D13]
MAEAVLMPKVGISVESCIITEWKKQPGDTVAAGDILFDYETDKSSLECESTAAGVLIEQFFGNGDEVPVLTAVCAIGAAGEDVGALRPGGSETAAPA